MVTHRPASRRLRTRSRVLSRPTHGVSTKSGYSTHTSEDQWFHRCRVGAHPATLVPSTPARGRCSGDEAGRPPSTEAGSRWFGGTATEAGWGSGEPHPALLCPCAPSPLCTCAPSPLCPCALGHAPDRALGRPCRVPAERVGSAEAVGLVELASHLVGVLLLGDDLCQQPGQRLGVQLCLDRVECVLDRG